jgi:hypothetical protein
VPESPHIRVYIPAYPPRFRRLWHAACFAFYLQIDSLGNQTALGEPLDRTQEVGGSNPPSSIASKALQTGHFGFRGAIRTGRKFPLVSGTSAQTALDMRGYAPIPIDYDWLRPRHQSYGRRVGTSPAGPLTALSRRVLERRYRLPNGTRSIGSKDPQSKTAVPRSPRMTRRGPILSKGATPAVPAADGAPPTASDHEPDPSSVAARSRKTTARIPPVAGRPRAAGRRRAGTKFRGAARASRRAELELRSPQH